MARPQQIKPGTWGRISWTQVSDDPPCFQAETRYRELSGVVRKVRARGSSETEAGSNLVEKLIDYRGSHMNHLDLSPTSTVSDLAAFWLAEKAVEGIEEDTVNGYRGVVKNHVITAIGALKLHECRTSTIDRVLKRHAADGSSTKKLKVVLQQMFDLALRHDAISVNPTVGVARIKAKKRKVRALDEVQVAEVRALIKAAMEVKRPGPRMSNLIPDVVDTMLGTGCRIGEALALRWVDLALDAEPATATFCGTIKTTTGKGTYRKPSTKSDSDLVVVLPPFLVDLLKRRRAEGPPNPLGAVFATRNGTWVQIANLSTQWNRIVDGTDYAWVTPHAMRRAVATLLNNALDNEAARAQLGHSSTAITDTYYIDRPTQAPDYTVHLERFRRRSDDTIDLEGSDRPNPEPEV